MSAAMGFTDEFLAIVLLILGLDLFIGLATMGRVATATSEDIRLLQGMNRLRHAYHDTVPGLESYFITGQYDDVRGIFASYDADIRLRSRRSILHGFTTVVGMLAVINSALSGVLVATLALLTVGGTAAVLGGLVAFGLVLVVTTDWMMRTVAGTVANLHPKFPTPPDAVRGELG
jgi:ABC-type transport system involved in cytochrome bd biosynthesis fused ATPase/permease subunit